MIQYTIASQQDDQAIRTILRDNDMSAWVNLSFEREPSFFAVKSPATEEFAVIARDENTLVGMYTYALQQIYCNGQASYLGYLGGLRVNQSYRNQFRILKEGFATIKHLMPATDYPFYFTSIGEENNKARRILESGVSGLPKYHFTGEIVTFALPVVQGKPLPNGWRLIAEEEIPTVLAFYKERAIQYQFSPVLDEQIIRHIGLNNFWIYYDEGVQACAAIWDQSAYKQIVAKKYRFPIDIVRPIYNTYAKITKRVSLPAIGTGLSYCYFAYLAFSDSVFHKELPLIRDLLRYCDSETAIVGFHAQHPMINVCKSLNGLAYKTRIYLVGELPDSLLESKPVQPEVALM